MLWKLDSVSIRLSGIRSIFRVLILFGLTLFLAGGCVKDALGPLSLEDIEWEESESDFRYFAILVNGKEYPATGAYKKEISVFVPVGTKLTNLVAVFRHEASYVTVDGVDQESGVSRNDFSDYKNGVKYRLEFDDGTATTYTVRVLDTKLPVLAVTTEGGVRITNRETWRNAKMVIRTPDGRLSGLGSAQIRGRGNWTWEKYPKKPYNFKLGTAQAVLGMPAHKRWVLLAGYQGFIGNALAFEISRRAPTIDWAPRGQFVELVLNGKFQGLYYLCEHIKIDENRVSITKLKKTDISYPEVSGGYLLEYDQLYDDPFKFYSSHFNLPVQLKSPKDSVKDEQFTYIRNFINDMEAELLKIGTSSESHYADYLDVDNFAEYWMVLETVNNYEAYKPRSVKFYKGRDGVDSPAGTVCRLKAGPLWDQEWFLVDHVFNSKDMYYYKYLFKDPAFVRTVKERWPAFKSNILGNDRYISILDYMNGFVKEISVSAARDIDYWNDPNFTLEDEVNRVRKGFVSKINWMDQQINAL